MICDTSFCLCVCSVVIFLHVSPGFAKPVSSISYTEDFLKSKNGNLEGIDLEEISTTTEPTLEYEVEVFASTLSPDEELDSSTSIGEVAETSGHSNTTAILVGILFAMTMIVKGIPVIIAYSITWYKKSRGEDKPGSEKEIEANRESENPSDRKILEVTMDEKPPAPSVEEREEKNTEKEQQTELNDEKALKDGFNSKQTDSMN